MTHLVAPSVNIFIVNGTKVLLGRRANTGWMDGYLCPPGGHVEKGETPTIAAVRELKEELGVTIDPNDLEFICVAARNNTPTEYVAYEFALRNKGHVFINAEPEKCSQLVWVELTDLPDDLVDHFRHIIEQGLIDKRPYLEVGF